LEAELRLDEVERVERNQGLDWRSLIADTGRRRPALELLKRRRSAAVTDRVTVSENAKKRTDAIAIT
jgi:hypothetical protein